MPIREKRCTVVTNIRSFKGISRIPGLAAEGNGPIGRYHPGAAIVTDRESDGNSRAADIDLSEEFDRKSFALPGPRSIAYSD